MWSWNENNRCAIIIKRNVIVDSATPLLSGQTLYIDTMTIVVVQPSWKSHARWQTCTSSCTGRIVVNNAPYILRFFRLSIPFLHIALIPFVCIVFTKSREKKYYVFKYTLTRTNYQINYNREHCIENSILTSIQVHRASQTIERISFQFTKSNAPCNVHPDLDLSLLEHHRGVTFMAYCVPTYWKILHFFTTLALCNESYFPRVSHEVGTRRVFQSSSTIIFSKIFNAFTPRPSTLSVIDFLQTAIKFLNIYFRSWFHEIDLEANSNRFLNFFTSIFNLFLELMSTLWQFLESVSHRLLVNSLESISSRFFAPNFTRFELWSIFSIEF